MDHKKKLVGCLRLFCMLLFSLLFVSGFTVCNAADDRPYQLNDALTQAIIDELQLGNYYSGDLIHQLTLNFNTFIRVQKATNEDIDLTSYIFYRDSSQQNYIRVCQDGWTTYAHAQNPTMPLHYIDFNYASSSYFTFRVFNNWTYDTNTGMINGVTTSNIQWWARPYNLAAINTGTGGNGIVGGGYNRTSGDGFFYLQHAVVLEIDGDSSTHHLMFGRNDQQVYGTYRFLHSLDIYDYLSGDVVPTPTPVPTGGGGGGSSTDLTTTNALISSVNNNLTDVPGSGDFTIDSGEFIEALGYTSIGDPSQDFWSFIINGLEVALTDTLRYISFDFLGETVVLDNEAWNIQNAELALLVQIACVAGFVIVQFKFIHRLVVRLSTLDIGDILLNLRDMDISDFF